MIGINLKPQLPWIEKYRPKTLEDISHHEDIIRMMEKTSETNELPHLLFYGPPGTGKTSTILTVCKRLFGEELYKTRVLELNASDERGISVVRNKIKKYAKYQVSNALNDLGKPAPPFKIIILDEADSMTNEAQNALRLIIEEYSNVTRFCFICNYIIDIIEPIKSRCAIFQFQQLSHNSMMKVLINISTKENMDFESDDVLETVINVSNGDMRKAVMILQNIKYVQLMDKRKITSDDVFAKSCHINPIICRKILSKIILSKDLKQVQKITEDIISNSYSIDNLFIQISSLILHHDDILEIQKAIIINKMTSIQIKILEGGDEYLQLLYCLSFINRNHKKIN